MIESPPAPDNWSKKYTDPYLSTEEGWVTVYDCTTNGKRAQMEVIWRGSNWKGPNQDAVKIQVYEFPCTEPKHQESEQIIDITVPVNEAKQKTDETAEAWITAIDNK